MQHYRMNVKFSDTLSTQKGRKLNARWGERVLDYEGAL